MKGRRKSGKRVNVFWQLVQRKRRTVNHFLTPRGNMARRGRVPWRWILPPQRGHWVRLSCAGSIAYANIRARVEPAFQSVSWRSVDEERVLSFFAPHHILTSVSHSKLYAAIIREWKQSKLPFIINFGSDNTLLMNGSSFRILVSNSLRVMSV